MLKRNQPAGITREPTIALRVYDTISLNPEKYGWVDVLSSVPITDVKQLSDERTRTSAGSTGLQGISEKRSAMVYWSQKGGLVTMKHANEHIPGSIVYAFRAGERRSGFFYHKDGKHPLGLVLLEHEGNPSHVKSKPRKYEGELMGVLQDLYPVELTKSKNRDETTYFTISFASLRDTDIGPLLAVMITVPHGETAYCVTAALDHPGSWQRWSFSASRVPTTRCFIAPDGKSVHLFTVALRPPRRTAGVLIAETIPEAFSKIERVPADVDDVPRVLNDAEPLVTGCLVVEETVVPVHSSKQVIAHRFYETASVRMTREQWEYTRMHPLLISAEETCLLLTVIVPMVKDTYVVHLACSDSSNSDNGGASGTGSDKRSVMQSHCKVLVGLENPVALSTLEGLTASNRTTRTSLSLILSKDLKIYACEVFGSVVRVNIEGASSIPIVVPQQEGKKKLKVGVSEITKAGKEEFVCLHQMPNGEVLFSNGAIAHFFCVTYAYLSTSAPSRQVQCPSLSLLDGSNTTNDTYAYEERLRAALTGIQEMISQNTNKEVIPEIFASRILPGLRFVGSAVMEMQLIQAVYRRVLEVASPSTEEDWLRLWELTRFIQRVISRRNREIAVHYMDHFFLQLAKVYHDSSFASPEGIIALKEGLLNVVSDELRLSILSPPPSAGVEYFFTAISNGTPYLSLALDLTRRLASVSVTDKGQCIGHTTPEGAPILHAMGFVLLASCVDVPLYLVPGGDAKQRIRCEVAPPLDAPFSLSVPVQSFDDQQQFNKALALAADLLSVAPATSYSEVEAAIFTIFIAHRYQCASTLFDLLDPVLTDALMRAAPLHNNREWFEECALAASIGCDDEVKRIITKTDGKHPIIPSLCFALQQNGVLNLPLYRVLEKRLSSEASTACLIILIFSLTESMIAAQNNYASATMKYLQCSQPLEVETEEAHVSMLEDRLRLVVKKNRQMWAWIHQLLPYKARDLAQSYIASLGMSLGSSSSVEPVGTMLSRTLVMCFRLFVFVSFSMEALDYLDQARHQFMKEGAGETETTSEENKTAAHTPEERCLSGLRYLFLADTAVIPREWYQLKLLQLLRSAYAPHTDSTQSGTMSSSFHWATFLLHILNLTDISVHCNVAAVKKEFFDFTDELRGRVRLAAAATVTTGGPSPSVQGSETGESTDEMRKYCRIAEEIANRHHRIISSSGQQERQLENRGDFIFSQRRDSTLPRWTFPHDRRERRYLIDTDWVHHLWALERDNALIASVAFSVAEQLIFESNELASLEKKQLKEHQSGNGVKHSDAPVLSRLLFASIHEELLPDHSFAAEVMHQMKVKNAVPSETAGVEPPSISTQIVANQQALAEREQHAAMDGTPGAEWKEGGVTKSLAEMADMETAVTGLPPLMAPAPAVKSDCSATGTDTPSTTQASSGQVPTLTLSLPPPALGSMTAPPPSLPLGNTNLMNSFIPANVSSAPSSSVSPVADAQSISQESRLDEEGKPLSTGATVFSPSETPVRSTSGRPESGSVATTSDDKTPVQNASSQEMSAAVSDAQNRSISPPVPVDSQENTHPSEEEKRHNTDENTERISPPPSASGGTVCGSAVVGSTKDIDAQKRTTVTPTPFSVDAVAWWENPISSQPGHEMSKVMMMLAGARQQLGDRSNAHRGMHDGSSDTSYETATTYTVGGTSYTPTPAATPEWQERWRYQLQHQRTGKGKTQDSSATLELSPHDVGRMPNRHRDVMSWNSDHLKPCKRAHANHGSPGTRTGRRGTYSKEMPHKRYDDDYIDEYEENTALRHYLRHLSKEVRCSSEPAPPRRTEVRHYHHYYPESGDWGDAKERSFEHTGVRCCHCRRNCSTHHHTDIARRRPYCADECDLCSDVNVSPPRTVREKGYPKMRERDEAHSAKKHERRSRGHHRAIESSTEEESERRFRKKRHARGYKEGKAYESSSTSNTSASNRASEIAAHRQPDPRRCSSPVGAPPRASSFSCRQPHHVDYNVVGSYSCSAPAATAYDHRTGEPAFGYEEGGRRHISNHANQDVPSAMPMPPPPSYVVPQERGFPGQGTSSAMRDLAGKTAAPVAITRAMSTSPAPPVTRNTTVIPPPFALESSSSTGNRGSGTARELCLLSLPNRAAVASATSGLGRGAYSIGAPPSAGALASGQSEKNKRVLLTPSRNGSGNGVRFTLHVPPPLPKEERHASAAGRSSSPPLLSIAAGRQKGEDAMRTQQRRALSVPPRPSGGCVNRGGPIVVNDGGGGGILKSTGVRTGGVGITAPPPLPLSPSAGRHAFFVTGADVAPNPHPASSVTLLSLHSPENKPGLNTVYPSSHREEELPTGASETNRGPAPSNLQVPPPPPPSLLPSSTAGGSQPGAGSAALQVIAAQMPTPTPTPTPAANNNVGMNPSSAIAPAPNSSPASETTRPSEQKGSTTVGGNAQLAYSAALASFLDGTGPAPPPPPPPPPTPPPQQQQQQSQPASSLPVSAMTPPVTQNATYPGYSISVPPSTVTAAPPPPPPPSSPSPYVPQPVPGSGVALAHPIPSLPSSGVTLTHNEEVDFQRYVKELLSRGQAEEASRISTLRNACAPPAPSPLSLVLGGVEQTHHTPDSTPSNTTIQVLCEQQKSFLQTAENFMRRREEESDRLCRQLEATVSAIQRQEQTRRDMGPLPTGPSLTPTVVSCGVAPLNNPAIPSEGNLPVTVLPPPISVLPSSTPLPRLASSSLEGQPIVVPTPSPASIVPTVAAPTPLGLSSPGSTNAQARAPGSFEDNARVVSPASGPLAQPPSLEWTHSPLPASGQLDASYLQRQRDELLALSEKTLEREIQEARARFAAASETLSSPPLIAAGTTVAAATTITNTSTPAAVPAPAPLPPSPATADKAVSTSPVEQAAVVPSTPSGVPPPLPVREMGSQARACSSPRKREIGSGRQARTCTTRQSMSRSPLPLRRGASEPRWRVPCGPPRDLEELYHRAAMSRPTHSTARAASHSRVAAPTASSKSRQGPERVRRSLEPPLELPSSGLVPAYTSEEVSPHPVYEWSPALPSQRGHDENQQLLNIPSYPQHGGNVYNLYVDRQVNRRKENILKRVALLNREFA